MIEVNVLEAAALFGMGLVTGLVLAWLGRRKPPSGPETAQESLSRLQGRSSVRKGPGQVLMANAPRPQVQREIPAAPPRGQGGISGGGHPRPEHTVWR